MQAPKHMRSDALVPSEMKPAYLSIYRPLIDMVSTGRAVCWALPAMTSAVLNALSLIVGRVHGHPVLPYSSSLVSRCSFQPYYHQLVLWCCRARPLGRRSRRMRNGCRSTNHPSLDLPSVREVQWLWMGKTSILSHASIPHVVATQAVWLFPS